MYQVNKSSVEKVSSNSGSSSAGWGELIRDKFDKFARRKEVLHTGSLLVDVSFLPTSLLILSFYILQYNFQEKNKDRNASPVGPEEEVIAELDSVIDSYRGPNQSNQTPFGSGAGTVAMRTKNKRRKEPEKNGGTWPKARVGVTSRHSNGTVMHHRRYLA